MNDLYFPLFGSTCFGLSPVHHQEHHLINCITHWYVRAIRRVQLLQQLDSPDSTNVHTHTHIQIYKSLLFVYCCNVYLNKQIRYIQKGLSGILKAYEENSRGSAYVVYWIFFLTYRCCKALSITVHLFSAFINFFRFLLGVISYEGLMVACQQATFCVCVCGKNSRI